MTQPQPGSPAWGTPPRPDGAGLVELARRVGDLEAAFSRQSVAVPFVFQAVNFSATGLTFPNDATEHTYNLSNQLTIPPGMTTATYSLYTSASCGWSNSTNNSIQVFLGSGTLTTNQAEFGYGNVVAGALFPQPLAGVQGGTFTGYTPGTTFYLSTLVKASGAMVASSGACYLTGTIMWTR